MFWPGLALSRHITHFFLFLSFSLSLSFSLCPPLTHCLSSTFSGPPSPPRNLVYTLKQSTVILEWAAPSDTGGRGDLTYSVGCRRCVRSPSTAATTTSLSSAAAVSSSSSSNNIQCEPCGPSVGFVPQQSGLAERTVTVVNLLPNANYTFTVEALNGVSELLPNKRFYTQVNVSTSLAGMSAPSPRFTNKRGCSEFRQVDFKHTPLGASGAQTSMSTVANWLVEKRYSAVRMLCAQE